MSEGCEHSVVMRSVSVPVVWACQGCGQEFVPTGTSNEALQDTLDAVAGTMSAVLWDYAERMHAKYGLAPKELDEEPPTCEDQNMPHDYGDDGVCRNCGHTPFLGAGSKE